MHHAQHAAARRNLTAGRGPESHAKFSRLAIKHVHTSDAYSLSGNGERGKPEGRVSDRSRQGFPRFIFLQYGVVLVGRCSNAAWKEKSMVRARLETEALYDTANMHDKPLIDQDVCQS